MSQESINLMKKTIKKMEDQGYCLHSDKLDPLWVRFSDFFKYAAGIGDRNFMLNEEHRERFTKYYNKYRLKISSDFNEYEKVFIENGIEIERYPIKCLEDVITKIVSGTAEIREIIEMHINIVSYLLSMRELRPVWVFAFDKCYAENALRVALQHKNYDLALDKALARINHEECKNTIPVTTCDITKEQIEKAVNAYSLAVNKPVKKRGNGCEESL